MEIKSNLKTESSRACRGVEQCSPRYGLYGTVILGNSHKHAAAWNKDRHSACLFPRVLDYSDGCNVEHPMAQRKTLKKGFSPFSSSDFTSKLRLALTLSQYLQSSFLIFFKLKRPENA